MELSETNVPRNSQKTEEKSALTSLAPDLYQDLSIRITDLLTNTSNMSGEDLLLIEVCIQRLNQLATEPGGLRLNQQLFVGSMLNGIKLVLDLLPSPQQSKAESARSINPLADELLSLLQVEKGRKSRERAKKIAAAIQLRKDTLEIDMGEDPQHKISEVRVLKILDAISAQLADLIANGRDEAEAAVNGKLLILEELLDVSETVYREGATRGGKPSSSYDDLIAKLQLQAKERLDGRWAHIVGVIRREVDFAYTDQKSDHRQVSDDRRAFLSEVITQFGGWKSDQDDAEEVLAILEKLLNIHSGGNLRVYRS